MHRIKPVSLMLILLFSVSLFSAQKFAVSEKYSDPKNKFSISYVKGFPVKKSSAGVVITSKDKALSVTVKVFGTSELAKIAADASKPAADTLDVLKSELALQGISKELSSDTNSVPESYLTGAKADSGSIVKYDLKKKKTPYVCRCMVFAKGSSIISISYAIVEKRGNDKYEKPADDMLRSFSFSEI